MPESLKQAVVLRPPQDVIPPAYPDDGNSVPVFLGCDDKFLPHALAVIASVMTHASPENNYDLFIVQAGIPQGRMDVTAAWMERYPNATLRFVDIGPSLAQVRGALITTKQFSVAVFFRIFAPEMFSEYGRIAYLDSDIAVRCDVADFYRLDLDGMEVGAVRDLATTSQGGSNPKLAEFWRKQLGKEPGEDYFFSGGLVMDLELMRRNGTQGQFLERIGRIRGSRLPDQDVMNAVLNGRVKYIPSEWNCLDWWCDDMEEAPNFGLLRPDLIDELREARRSAKVVHFAEKKPWTMDYRGKYAEEYWRFAAETPFYPQLLEQVRRDSGPIRMLWRKFLTRMQEGHFTVKLCAAPRERRAKYLARLRNLRWRRKGLERQREFIEKLLREGGVPGTCAGAGAEVKEKDNV